MSFIQTKKGIISKNRFTYLQEMIKYKYKICFIIKSKKLCCNYDRRTFFSMNFKKGSDNMLKGKHKGVLTIFFILFLVLSFTACNVIQKTDMSKYADYKYIASKSSKKFHTRSCFLGKRIALEDAVFFDNRSDAIAAGYKPDDVCNP